MRELTEPDNPLVANKPTPREARPLISVVTPCFNEEDNVGELYRQVKEVFAGLPQYRYEHLFVDNASRDRTVARLREIAAEDRNVRVIVNARNFGHIRSPYHALFQTRGSAVIAIVADLQDPPTMIVDFLRKWEEGFKIVFGVKERSEEPVLMFAIRRAYYSLVSRLSEVELVQNTTGFGLYDRRVIDILARIDDPYPYFRGLAADIGFPAAKIAYRQPARKWGVTKNNFYTLYDLAMLGITNHSKVPLRLATMVGFLMSGLSLLLAFGYLAAKLLFWMKFPLGLAPVLIGLFFFSSVQLFFIGILGEYIGSIHTQVLKRPLVIELERINFDEEPAKQRAESELEVGVTPLSEVDLAETLEDAREAFLALRGARLFVTGGTGFFGRWLLETLLWANDRLALEVEITVLTRRPDGFRAEQPHLAGHPALTLHEGDVRSFAFPAGRFTHVVHAATSTSVKAGEVERPLETIDTIIQGTRRTLELARWSGAQRVLFTSSGAVYGRQPTDILHVTEEHAGAPDCMDTRAAYGHAKRVAENLCAQVASDGTLQVVIARPFAFVGAHLPLDAHFAIGNFIGDGLEGRPVQVRGDGSPLRSYLYGSDLATWLWVLLAKGRSCRPYNVGSDQPVSIADLASMVGRFFDVPVRILGGPAAATPPERYVPDTTRAHRGLGLCQRIDLPDAIARTVASLK